MLQRLGLIVLVLAGLSAYAYAEDKKFDAGKLVGKWQPDAKDAPPSGKITIEMFKDGKLTLSADLGGQSMNVEGSYKLQGDKLTIKMKFPGAPEERSADLTIVKLDDEVLVTKEGDKKEETLKRIK